MSARDDYPELGRIANGFGVHVLEEAEEQAAAALDELAGWRRLGRTPQEITEALATADAVDAWFDARIAYEQAPLDTTQADDAVLEQRIDDAYKALVSAAGRSGSIIE